MNTLHFDLLRKLVNPSYAAQAEQARNSRSKLITNLLTQRRMPDEGWREEDIQSFLEELASYDSNNFMGNVGVGEREGRVISDLVRRRHFGLAHGIGRSGDAMAEQPKAAGSTCIVQLVRYLALDAIRLAGIKAARHCCVLPAATGLSMALVFLALRQLRPSGKYVVWSRIDQKSCFKAITTAGLRPLVVELRHSEVSDALVTDVQGIRATIERVSATEVLCICTTTSCFSPRTPDSVDEVAVIAKEMEVPHVINNAYGLQCSKCTHLVETACRIGRVDAFVQSTDKNFLVPVGGAIVAGPTSELVDRVSSLYPGRASMSPILDLFITLLSLGASGWKSLLQERKEAAEWFQKSFSAAAERHGLRLLWVPGNRISFACDLTGLGLARQERRSGPQRPGGGEPRGHGRGAGAAREPAGDEHQDAGAGADAGADADADAYADTDEHLTFLGSALFTRRVSGPRVVLCAKSSTQIDGKKGDSEVGHQDGQLQPADPQPQAAAWKGLYRKTIDGIDFDSYGAHTGAYPCCYMTAAVALGSTRAELITFLERFDDAVKDFKAGAWRKGKKESATDT